MGRWSLKGKNKGASLLAVLVVLTFVGAIAAIITRVTLVNIQMKEVEESSRKNFYTAESVMEELTAGVGEVSANAMDEAYAEVMQNYISYTSSGTSMQDAFARLYVANLETYFQAAEPNRQVSTETAADGITAEEVYALADYDVEKLRGCISTAANQSCLVTAAADASYSVDYLEGVFILKNVKVTKQTSDYETTITTDLVFETPALNFTGADQVKDFMAYSLIADDQILVAASNIRIDGNVYAGADGILASTTGEGSLTGDVIVTRGDIVTEAGSSLSVGSSSSAIWAENIMTTGKSASQLSLTGNCYVADDLAANGISSTITLTGKYYGYNFQENYSTSQSENDSAFSSAMMVNAKDSTIDLQNLTYLMLAGRTFISRSSGGTSSNSDVLLGESLSVRSNQLAYYVPKNYLDNTYTMFTEDGATAYEQETGVSDIADYLDPANQVVPYYYINTVTSGTNVNYYLNFKDEQSANDFFAVYMENSGKEQILGYAESYLADDAIILDSNLIYTLKGDIMYRQSSGKELEELKVTIGTNDWNVNGVYWDLSSQLAVKYKSLQLSLKESASGVTADNVRITDSSGNVDKTKEPLFDTLIDTAAFSAANISAGGDVVYEATSGNTKRVVVLVDNEGGAAYQVGSDMTEGLIVATGDVYVTYHFTGLIISGGTISFASNASVDADEQLVAALFADDLTKDAPAFSQYFKDYSTSTASYASASLNVSDYITYENWKKN